MPEIIVNSVVLFFVWLFAVAAWHKLSAADYYQQLVSAYLGRGAPARLLTLCIAVTELLAVSLLLYGPTRSTGLQLALVLLLAYASLMAWQLWRSPTAVNIKCGCAGPASDTRISPVLVLRNLACGVLALLALGPMTAAQPGVMAWSLSTLAGLFMVLMYLCAEQLISNAQRINEWRT